MKRLVIVGLLFVLVGRLVGVVDVLVAKRLATQRLAEPPPKRVLNVAPESEDAAKCWRVITTIETGRQTSANEHENRVRCTDLLESSRSLLRPQLQLVEPSFERHLQAAVRGADEAFLSKGDTRPDGASFGRESLQARELDAIRSAKTLPEAFAHVTTEWSERVVCDAFFDTLDATRTWLTVRELLDGGGGQVDLCEQGKRASGGRTALDVEDIEGCGEREARRLGRLDDWDEKRGYFASVYRHCAPATGVPTSEDAKL